jgi:hypothetical protein
MDRFTGSLLLGFPLPDESGFDIGAVKGFYWILFRKKKGVLFMPSRSLVMGVCWKL